MGDANDDRSELPIPATPDDRDGAVERERVRKQTQERLFGVASEPVTVGRFEVVHRIGAGAMGVVYKARDPNLERWVAVKLLADGGSGSPQRQARMLREAKAMARLSHPNVVVVHEVGEHDGQVFIAMEYVDGANLREWLEQERPTVGELIGTPAYMAPEQLHGRSADPRSDQFSFCAMLFEALYGVRPFVGVNVGQLLWALTTGKMSVPAEDVDVPVGVHQILQQGLSIDPDERYSSLGELLGQRQLRGAQRSEVQGVHPLPQPRRVLPRQQDELRGGQRRRLPGLGPLPGPGGVQGAQGAVRALSQSVVAHQGHHRPRVGVRAPPFAQPRPRSSCGRARGPAAEPRKKMNNLRGGAPFLRAGPPGPRILPWAPMCACEKPPRTNVQYRATADHAAKRRWTMDRRGDDDASEARERRRQRANPRERSRYEAFANGLAPLSPPDREAGTTMSTASRPP